MIELRNNMLAFSFPEVHREARCLIDFQRTLRIPDDNRDYPLPPGLGRFPVHQVDDFRDRLPQAWGWHGGVFLPMHQSEALWIKFSGSYPCAVKIAAGKINAVTGEAWSNALDPSPQDYLVVPGQPWLDGFAVSKGLIRQFVAMPLGAGYSAEEQLTGEAEHGGIQILVRPMKAKRYKELKARLPKKTRRRTLSRPCGSAPSGAAPDMGLSPGGLMRQEIFRDKHGGHAWDRDAVSRCYVHIASSLSYFSITGRRPPHAPPGAKEYAGAGLPWFEYYGGDKDALDGAEKLAGLDSVAAMAVKKGQGSIPGNEPVTPAQVVRLAAESPVREGEL